MDDLVILDDIPGRPGETLELTPEMLEWVRDLVERRVVTVYSTLVIHPEEPDAPSL